MDGIADLQRLFEFVRELTTKMRNLVEAFDALLNQLKLLAWL